jgi:hypothetical protein
MKRKDLEVGKWYYNPMMEKYGFFKGLRYVRISAIDEKVSSTCNYILYDQGVTIHGERVDLKDCRQSNEDYETYMEEVEESKIALFCKNKKFGL